MGRWMRIRRSWPRYCCGDQKVEEERGVRRSLTGILPELRRNFTGVDAGDNGGAPGDQCEPAKSMARSSFSGAVPNDDDADSSSGEIQMLG